MRRTRYEHIEDGSYFGDIPGFDGPYFDGSHKFMRKGTLKLPFPNPYRPVIGLPLLKHILGKVDITLAG